MAESSIWWTTDGTGDGVGGGYTQAQLIKFFRALFASDNTDEGVMMGYSNELAVSGTATPVSVAAGAALCYGFGYFSTAAETVAVPTPSGNTRIDRIVLQADWTAQTVRIARVAGVEGAGTPPALTQTDGTTWEISLAQASITTGGTITVTDEREWLHPNIEIETAMIKAAAVTLAKMAANSVDSDQYVNASIDTAHLGNLQVTAAKLATEAVETAKIKDANVTLAKMAAESVDSDQYVDGSIDAAHIATDAVETAKIKDANVTLAKMAADSVDDTKAGNRVPQFYRRQGGSSSIWSTAGGSTYTPTAVRMQAGVVNIIDSGSVTFPVTFSQPPILLYQVMEEDKYAYPSNLAAATVNFYVKTLAGVISSGTVHWLAIGPE